MLKRKLCAGLAAMLLCGCSAPYSEISGTGVTGISETASGLPADAERALWEYMRCDSMEKLADYILPSAAAEEMKSGKLTQGNYFFSGFPCADYTDGVIQSCEKMTKQEVNRMAAFLTASIAMQGSSAEIDADAGYYAVAAATYAVAGEMETVKIRVTRKVMLLHVPDDRWIFMPTAEDDSNRTEYLDAGLLSEAETDE